MSIPRRRPLLDSKGSMTRRDMTATGHEDRRDTKRCIQVSGIVSRGPTSHICLFQPAGSRKSCWTYESLGVLVFFAHLTLLRLGAYSFLF